MRTKNRMAPLLPPSGGYIFTSVFLFVCLSPGPDMQADTLCCKTFTNFVHGRVAHRQRTNLLNFGWIWLNENPNKNLAAEMNEKCLIALIIIILYKSLPIHKQTELIKKNNGLDSSIVYRIEWSWTKKHATFSFA